MIIEQPKHTRLAEYYQNPMKKNVERGNIDTPNAHIHDRRAYEGGRGVQPVHRSRAQKAMKGACESLKGPVDVLF